MGHRHRIGWLFLTAAASVPLGCGKSDNNTATTSATPAPNAAAMQMNIGGPPSVALNADNIRAEIDKAGAGVKLVKLDLTSVGVPLTMDAPEGAKAQLDPRALSLRNWVDVEVSAGDHFFLRIRLGKHHLEQKRRRLAGQPSLVNTKDLLFFASALLLEERCEFARHVVAGLQDYTLENVDPILEQRINHSQADCLLMLKCAATLKPCMMPSENPMSALQECNAAVVKDAKGRVVNVGMDPRQTTDATLAPLTKLPDLEHLILNRCAVTDDGMAHVAKMPKLKEISLTDCPITDAGLSSLSGLVHLEKLNLASAFGDSPRIKGDGLASLGKLDALQVLVLDNNLVDDAGLTALKNVHGLRELYLEQTRVVGPGLANLKELKHLSKLWLNENKLSDAGLANLAELSGLEELNLRGCPVAGEGLKNLKGLTKLHTLNLGNTRLNDEGVAHLADLKGLKTLVLEGTEITDAAIPTLQAMKGLKRLALARTKITEAGADKLKSALSGVEISLK
jgi:hypothetical protein